MSRPYVSQVLRKHIAARARHRCGYCLTSEAIVGTRMEIEHIVPLALGGPTEEANLWLACSTCNEHKGSRIAALDPHTGERVPLFSPRKHTWSEHFVWSREGTHIHGRTSIGRATVRALNLNRPQLVRSRRRWVQVGWHPPKDV